MPSSCHGTGTTTPPLGHGEKMIFVLMTLFIIVIKTSKYQFAIAKLAVHGLATVNIIFHRKILLYIRLVADLSIYDYKFIERTLFVLIFDNVSLDNVFNIYIVLYFPERKLHINTRCGRRTNHTAMQTLHVQPTTKGGLWKCTAVVGTSYE